jgi:hypothetical protein
VKTANPTFNEGLSKLIAAHPNWTDDEKIRAMKAYVGANGGGGNATGTHQPGDIVTQNGVQYRVTAVDANGKPTAAQPVQ